MTSKNACRSPELLELGPQGLQFGQTGASPLCHRNMLSIGLSPATSACACASVRVGVRLRPLAACACLYMSLSACLKY